MNLRQRFETVRARIRQAALEAGRSESEIKLIAVSKKVPAAVLQEAAGLGQTVFGENLVQEAVRKMQAVDNPSLEWHLIGHLQSNKAKFVPGAFGWLHSLDGVKLAERLSRFATESKSSLNCLIEVNVTEDPKKSGISVKQTEPLIDALLKSDFPGLKIRGLMTIGPYEAPEAELRRVFATLRDLRDRCRTRFGLRDFTELSMGMTGDFEVAIKEGAPMVRIGTALFGARPAA